MAGSPGINDANPRDLVVTAALSLLRGRDGGDGKFVKFKYDSRGNRGPGYLDDDVMDRSEFVYQVFTRARFGDFPRLNSHGYASSGGFTKSETPQRGDIVYWSRGHVAIVLAPGTGEFAGSQTSTGPAKSNYLQNIFWKAQPGRAYYRWAKLEGN